MLSQNHFTKVEYEGASSYHARQKRAEEEMEGKGEGWGERGERELSDLFNQFQIFKN